MIVINNPGHHGTLHLSYAHFLSPKSAFNCSVPSLLDSSAPSSLSLSSLLAPPSSPGTGRIRRHIPKPYNSNGHFFTYLLKLVRDLGIFLGAHVAELNKTVSGPIVNKVNFKIPHPRRHHILPCSIRLKTGRPVKL